MINKSQKGYSIVFSNFILHVSGLGNGLFWNILCFVSVFLRLVFGGVGGARVRLFVCSSGDRFRFTSLPLIMLLKIVRVISRNSSTGISCEIYMRSYFHIIPYSG